VTHHEFRDGSVAYDMFRIVQRHTGTLKSLTDASEVSFDPQRLSNGFPAHATEADDGAVLGSEALVLEQATEQGPEHAGPKCRVCGTVAGKEQREERRSVDTRGEMGKRLLRSECLGEEYG
jgi:hypothetical protein